jgi:hypothetical protein
LVAKSAATRSCVLARFTLSGHTGRGYRTPATNYPIDTTTTTTASTDTSTSADPDPPPPF